jgi:hypothetical protein
MNHYRARQISISKLAMPALLALCFLQLPMIASATKADVEPLPSPAYDHRDGPCYIAFAPIGLVFGQTLRITVAHVSGDAGQEQAPPDLRVGVWILDAQGRTIAQSAPVQIPRGGFHSFDFDRAALPLSGEPGTGRLQVSARLVMRVAEPYTFTDDPKAPAWIVPSLELIDNSTGRTAAGICCTNNLKQIGLATH